ncbi:MAG: GNAT family N-acetyltransferase [Alphaproteobacteria bacterium]|nr:GNAT family N-acetyltransferase [Alphaproteobacteria bacterium]
MADIILRRAAPSDARLVLDLIQAAFAEYRGKLKPESGAYGETPEGLAAQLVGRQGALIAERDGEAVGCVLFRDEGEDLYFGRLSVLPEHRRAGVAEALVAAVEDEARARGASGVLLGVRIALTGNQRLFARLGYVEISREAHPGFSEPTSINMRKALQ